MRRAYLFIVKSNNMALDGRTTGQAKPELGKPYWVQCESYRTMATMNQNEKWLKVFDGKELEGVLSFFKIE